MSRLAPADAWRARLRAAAEAPPRAPRLPLSWRGERIGSVEDTFVDALRSPLLLRGPDGVAVQGDDLTQSLDATALRMRERGLAHAWRDEQLAVRGEAGTLLGTVERGAVRPLGIVTHAVHLMAVDEEGRHWVQRRAFDKPTDPGQWDTLVGGMVPASDTLPQALERETWEEAGLRLAQLRDLRHGGRLLTRRPFRELASGYIVEWLDWYTCKLSADVAPANQDGEVAAFRRMQSEEVTQRLEQDEFTIAAGLLLLAAFSSSPFPGDPA